MAKAYTTSTASIKVPVVLSFTCPKCGQYGTVNKTALLSSQATVRGYNSSGAGAIAQQNLAASAGSQMNFLVERLEKGQLNALLDDKGRSPSKYVACPHCGIRQIVDVEPRRTLYPRLFALRLIGLFFAFLWRGYRVASRAKDTFSMLTAYGITTHFAVQIIGHMLVFRYNILTRIRTS